MKEIFINNLPYIQITISVLLIISILLQQTGAMIGAGATFGGGSDVNVKSTRRGLEKKLLKISIILSVLFFISALFTLPKFQTLIFG